MITDYKAFIRAKADEMREYIHSATAAIGRPISLSAADVIITEPGNHKFWSVKEPNKALTKERYQTDACMYIYSFWCEEQEEERPLKIGKAGPNSHGRYTGHHYNPNSSQSCLAKSLLLQEGQPLLKAWGIASNDHIPTAIKSHCYRIDIRLHYDPTNEKGYDIFTLNLIESILHYIYDPVFEGYETQREN